MRPRQRPPKTPRSARACRLESRLAAHGLVVTDAKVFDGLLRMLHDLYHGDAGADAEQAEVERDFQRMML